MELFLGDEYHEKEEDEKSEEPVENEKPEENPEESEPLVEAEEEPEPQEEVVEPAPLVTAEAIGDLLGLNEEVNPKAAELEESNALALAIIQPGNDPLSLSRDLNQISGSGWELALVTTPSNNTGQVVDSKLAGGFDNLLLNSLYEDDSARRQIQLQNAGYGHGGMAVPNPFEQQHDPFAMSINIAPPTNVQMALLAEQQQQHQQLQMMQQQQQQYPQTNMMVPYQNPNQYQHHQQQIQQMNNANPFGDPFLALPNGSTPQQGNHMLL